MNITQTLLLLILILLRQDYYSNLNIAQTEYYLDLNITEDVNIAQTESKVDSLLIKLTF